MLASHIFVIICRRDKACYDYLLDWMANCVQKANEQARTVVVMRGGEGVGKGLLAHAMRKLFGSHGLHVSQAEHLTGKFNAHLRETVFLFADECFYAGDKKHEGVLKALVTEDVLQIERKNVDPVSARNYLHVVMASNNDWVVPASLDSRRFFVLDVSDEKKNDHAYFEAIIAELNSGGLEAMLFDLLRRDLTGFRIADVPKTAALYEQRIKSMKTEEQWLYRVLCQGYIRPAYYGHDPRFESWGPVTTEFCHTAYEAFARERRERHPLDLGDFGRFLSRAGFPERYKTRAALHGEETDGTGKMQPLLNRTRKPGPKFGALEEARTAFANATGLVINWPEPGDTPDAGDWLEDEERDKAAPF